MLDDPMFWYAVAFAIFCTLVFRYARKPALGWLDGEIAKIRDELARARSLRAEAETALAGYKKKHAEALAEAEVIIRHAKDEAAQLKIQAEADLKAALARHEQQAAERIRIAETEALAAVRAAAVEGAMDMARKQLGDSSGNAAKLADQAIAELPKLAAKANAA
jgi:F-type H+-transporting ATPase subunit b